MFLEISEKKENLHAGTCFQSILKGTNMRLSRGGKGETSNPSKRLSESTWIQETVETMASNQGRTFVFEELRT